MKVNMFLAIENRLNCNNTNDEHRKDELNEEAGKLKLDGGSPLSTEEYRWLLAKYQKAMKVPTDQKV